MCLNDARLSRRMPLNHGVSNTPQIKLSEHLFCRLLLAIGLPRDRQNTICLHFNVLILSNIEKSCGRRQFKERQRDLLLYHIENFLLTIGINGLIQRLLIGKDSALDQSELVSPWIF